jgi:ABC-type dipeptide/oligopeptide/nickel transport system permease subunit
VFLFFVLLACSSGRCCGPRIEFDLHRHPRDHAIPGPATLGAPVGHRPTGRDILARMMAGGQVSIAVGLTAMALSVLLGT